MNCFSSKHKKTAKKGEYVFLVTFKWLRISTFNVKNKNIFTTFNSITVHTRANRYGLFSTQPKKTKKPYHIVNLEAYNTLIFKNILPHYR